MDESSRLRTGMFFYPHIYPHISPSLRSMLPSLKQISHVRSRHSVDGSVPFQDEGEGASARWNSVEGTPPCLALTPPPSRPGIVRTLMIAHNEWHCLKTDELMTQIFGNGLIALLICIVFSLFILVFRLYLFQKGFVFLPYVYHIFFVKNSLVYLLHERREIISSVLSSQRFAAACFRCFFLSFLSR